MLTDKIYFILKRPAKLKLLADEYLEVSAEGYYMLGPSTFNTERQEIKECFGTSDISRITVKVEL